MLRFCNALLLLLVLGSPAAQAQQKTNAQLQTEILNNIPSGNPSVLTAASLRQVLQDMVNSSVSTGPNGGVYYNNGNVLGTSATLPSGLTIPGYVTGPGSSTVGDVPYFTGSAGAALGDSGLAYDTLAVGPGSSTIGCAAPWADTTGTQLANNCVLSLSGNTVLVESSGVTTTPFTVRYTNLAPTGIDTATGIVSDCLGNNSTFIGCSNGDFIAGDDATVTTSTKGVLYGLQLGVAPLVARDNSPYDDADAFIVANNSPNGSKATEAIAVTAGGGFSGTAHQWGVDIYAGASADIGFALGSGTSTAFDYGVDLCYGGTCPTIADAAIRVPNAISAVSFRNAAGNADLQALASDSSNDTIIGGTGVNAVLAPVGIVATGGSEDSSIDGLQLYGSSSGWNILTGGLGGYQNLTIDAELLNLQSNGGATAVGGALTVASGDFEVTGSSTGYTALASANAGASNYTATLPAATDTIAELTQTQTLTNKTIAYGSNTLTGVAPLASPTFTGTFNINGIGGAGSASKYVCVDSSGNMLTQSGAC